MNRTKALGGANFLLMSNVFSNDFLKRQGEQSGPVSGCAFLLASLRASGALYEALTAGAAPAAAL